MKHAMLCLTCFFSFALSASALDYRTFSLKVARQRVESAGQDWRQKEPEVWTLASINKVEGFVYDPKNDDLILVGQHEEERAGLTLDDLVVALRARFRYGQWPLVSIDPTPDTEKTQMQHVRFEGGIAETAFGRDLFDADYRLKRIGIGLLEPGINNIRTKWDAMIRRIEDGTEKGPKEVHSRFWFYPINPHVVVREGVCVVRGLTVGVFTEVLGARIDGKPVADLTAFKDASADTFARDVSEYFDSLCQRHESFNRLRGLQELVAVSKALQEMAEQPDLSWWLEQYRLETVKTTKSVCLLRREYQRCRGPATFGSSSEWAPHPTSCGQNFTRNGTTAAHYSSLPPATPCEHAPRTIDTTAALGLRYLGRNRSFPRGLLPA